MKVHIVYSICLKRYVVISDFTYEPPQYAHLGSYALSHALPNTPHSADPNSHAHIWDLCPPGGISSSRAVMRDGTRSSEKESSGKVKAAAVPVVAGVVVKPFFIKLDSQTVFSYVAC